MTVTDRKAENDLTPLLRVQQNASGRVIRVIKSDSGLMYHVTIVDGHVSSCLTASGEECKGWHWRRSCHHATLAMQLEAERDAERTAYNNYELAIGA